MTILVVLDSKVHRSGLPIAGTVTGVIAAGAIVGSQSSGTRHCDRYRFSRYRYRLRRFRRGVAVALAPAVKGATRPSQQITWTRPDGTAENLTGATVTGSPGDLAYDGSYFYVCIATDTWLRAAISTWP